MTQATVTFDLAGESVTSVLDITLETEMIITGNFAGAVPAGTTARLRGAVNLLGNLHVRGTLTSDLTGVNLNGNGFDIHTHDGGVLELVGVVKTAWCTWGDPVNGWQVGDRLAVTPTKAGKTLVLPEILWSGDWATMTRPIDAPDVTLIDGSVHLPEVVNLERSLILRNLDRIMLHESDVTNVHTLKWFKVLDTGKSEVDAGELGHYPIHFHQLYDTCRGSTVEGVLVEGGKNHAFVPHGSHGITFTDCVAYKTTDSAFWWDPPGSPGDMTDLNNSHDTTWNHCLALGVNPSDPSDVRFTGFAIGEGFNNVCVGCVAVAVGGAAGGGGKNSSGFRWQQNSVWQFDNCVAHNNRRNGIFSWTQSPEDHLIENFDAYHNRRSGIEHGSYINSFTYRNCLLHTGIKVATGSDATAGIMQFALSRGDGLLFEDVVTDDRLTVGEHGIATVQPVIHRRCSYSNVIYQEGSVKAASVDHFEDCGLTPADFQFTTVRPTSVIEIYEGGTLLHRAVGGVWE